ncbi:MAG: DEAD/DEAH box helicase, partial [Candidatus Pelagibacterales bacterium]
KPQIVVGTPGRVNDHLKRKSLLLNKVDLLILDEMDRMLDMGFSIQIDEIIKFLPKQKQTLMFSATIAPSIERLSKKYLNNAERVSVAAANATLITIKQEVINLRQEDKYNTLVEQVKTKHGSTLVFVKTKHNAKKLAKNLEKEGFESDSLHGNLRQNKRNQVIAKFRANKIHVLVATDIAARGLDIPHIEHVVNFDLPQQAEDFIHRMGRTGRAGASGTAWSFVTPSDKRKWHEIEKILNPGLKSSPDSKRSGGRRDDYSKKRPFKRGGPRDGFRSDKGGKSSFRDKKKTSFRRDDKKETSFKKSDKKDFSSRKPSEFRSEGKKSKPKNAGYGRKTPSSDRPKRGNGFGNREDRAPSFKSRSNSKEGFAEKGKSDFSEKRKKGSGFHDRKKASFEKSEGKFTGEKKGPFDRKSKGGKSFGSRKKSGFKPGGKKPFKKKF